MNRAEGGESLISSSDFIAPDVGKNLIKILIVALKLEELYVFMHHLIALETLYFKSFEFDPLGLTVWPLTEKCELPPDGALFKIQFLFISCQMLRPILLHSKAKM
jgi:hypothetical protein